MIVGDGDDDNDGGSGPPPEELVDDVRGLHAPPKTVNEPRRVWDVVTVSLNFCNNSFIVRLEVLTLTDEGNPVQ